MSRYVSQIQLVSDIAEALTRRGHGDAEPRHMNATMADTTPLEKAKALLYARRKATQGPFRVPNKEIPFVLAPDNTSPEPRELVVHSVDLQCASWVNGCNGHRQRLCNDAQFFTFAANHAEAICTRLVELEQENAELRARLEEKG